MLTGKTCACTSSKCRLYICTGTGLCFMNRILCNFVFMVWSLSNSLQYVTNLQFSLAVEKRFSLLHYNADFNLFSLVFWVGWLDISVHLSRL